MFKSFEKRLLLGVGIIVIAIIIAGVLSLKSYHKVLATSQNIEDADNLLKEVNTTLSATLDIEEISNKYVLLGYENLRNDFSDAANKALNQVKELHKVAVYQPGVKDPINTLDTLIRSRIIVARELMQIKNNKAGSDIAIRKISAQGTRLTAQIRVILNQIGDAGNATHIAKKIENENAAKRMSNIFQVLLYLILLAILLGVFLVWRNFIKKKEMEKRLLEFNIDLEKRVQERTKDLDTINKEMKLFIYRLSHDIRGPAASVQGLVQIALGEVRDESSREFFVLIRSSISQLAETVNNLLELAKITNHSEIEPETFSIDTLINEQSYRLKSEIEKSSIQFYNETKKDLIITSDKNLVNIILEQVLDNSLKFAHNNNHEKYVKTKVTPDKGGFHIIIEDNGEGISEDVIPHVFNMFYRGNNRSGGSGLGLFIVNKAIEKLNGKIELLSEIGKGTTINVWIPDPFENNNMN